MTITERREFGSAATEAIEPAFKMAFGVSIIAQMRVASGASASRSTRAASHDRPGAVDLGQENGVRPRGGGGDKILLSPGRMRPIDTNDHLASAKSACAHGLCDLFAGGDFLVRGDRILEIKDQRVGGQRLGFRQGFGVGAGHVEDASTRAGKHEHLPILGARI